MREGLRIMAAGVLGLLCGAVPAEASFPGRDGRIAFEVLGGLRDSDGCPKRVIFSVQPDGRGLRRLGPGGDPAWSPMGRRLAFSSCLRMGLMRADGSHRRLLPRPRVDASEPAWSPDGKRLVFSGRVKGGLQTGILMLRLNGGRPRQVAAPTDAGFFARPRWSIHNLIGFTGSGFRDTVLTVRPDGQEPRRLTSGGFGDWSPDGNRFVFERRSVLFTMSTTGSAQPRRLISGGVGPVWSPDGQRIAFVRYGLRAVSSIYVVRPNGTGLRLVYRLRGSGNAEGEIASLDWQPRH